ncbi:fungal-specific transcription factor domain-containing protein [Camillea tinctor]|nr:fungal-specific transcription factor domain-containing protein [Camillea tinctor]
MVKHPRTRSRTFTGCKTCRLRHAKCISCEGYEPQLFWVADDPGSGGGSDPDAQQQSHRASGFRYPLYSEVYRRQMSAQVNQSMRDRSATELLFQIDTKCERQDLPSTGDIMLGPFGVFDTKIVRPVLDEPSTSSLTEINCDGEGLIEVGRDDWCELDELEFGLFSHDFTPTLDRLELDEGSSDLASQNLSLFNYLPLSHPLDLDESPSYTHTDTTGIPVTKTSEEAEGNPSDTRGLTSSISRPTSGPETDLPEQAAHLLRYHKQRLMEPSSQMQAQRKSPWRILFLPCALETFAEISIFNSASNTKSAVLYSILANSAFQLHLSDKSTSTSSSSSWLEVGMRHRDAAKSRLREALRLEAIGPNQAEYKDLLMAVLGCAMTALYDNTQNFMYFLLDAERLIRLRGLSAKKSTKVRLLHHMYTHLRVIAESTAAGMITRPNNHTGGSLNIITPGTIQLHQFSVPEDSLTRGLDPTKEKQDDDGYNDIHLEVQGRWDRTLFPNIYGVPESLVTLLSQIISFANNKERLERIAHKSPKVSAAMASHVKTLENTVWSWSFSGPIRPPSLIADSEDGQFLVDQPNTRSMVSAMHQAILIYFYRRVYNMSAMMLQDLVRKTLNHLKPCIDEQVDDQDFAACIAWSAFIAGCEAVTSELQDQALECIVAIESRASIFSAQPATKVVKNIWEQRSRTGDWTLSWPNVM